MNLKVFTKLLELMYTIQQVSKMKMFLTFQFIKFSGFNLFFIVDLCSAQIFVLQRLNDSHYHAPQLSFLYTLLQDDSLCLRICEQ